MRSPQGPQRSAGRRGRGFLPREEWRLDRQGKKSRAAPLRQDGRRRSRISSGQIGPSRAVTVAGRSGREPHGARN